MTEEQMVEKRRADEVVLKSAHRTALDAALALPGGTQVEQRMRDNAIAKAHADFNAGARAMVARHQAEENALRANLGAERTPE